MHAFILPLESSCLVIESHLVTIDSDPFCWERYFVEKPGSTSNPVPVSLMSRSFIITQPPLSSPQTVPKEPDCSSLDLYILTLTVLSHLWMVHLSSKASIILIAAYTRTSGELCDAFSILAFHLFVYYVPCWGLNSGPYVCWWSVPPVSYPLHLGFRAPVLMCLSAGGSMYERIMEQSVGLPQ